MFGRDSLTIPSTSIASSLAKEPPKNKTDLANLLICKATPYQRIPCSSAACNSLLHSIVRDELIFVKKLIKIYRRFICIVEILNEFYLQILQLYIILMRYLLCEQFFIEQ